MPETSHASVTVCLKAKASRGRGKDYYAAAHAFADYLKAQHLTPIQSNKLLALLADCVETAERDAFQEGMDMLSDTFSSEEFQGIMAELTAQGLTHAPVYFQRID